MSALRKNRKEYRDGGLTVTAEGKKKIGIILDKRQEIRMVSTS